MDKEYEELATIPFYIHEAVCDKIERNTEFALTKMDDGNRRMMNVIIAVCVTLAICIVMSVVGFIVINKRWINYLDTHYTVEEVNDGNVLDEGNQGDNQ